MAEADPEGGDAADRLARQLNRPVEDRRVPWSVGENQAVGTSRGDL